MNRVQKHAVFGMRHLACEINVSRYSLASQTKTCVCNRGPITSKLSERYKNVAQKISRTYENKLNVFFKSLTTMNIEDILFNESFI